MGDVVQVPQYDTKECNVGWRYYYIATANNDGQNTNGYEANLPNGKFINTFNDYGKVLAPSASRHRRHCRLRVLTPHLVPSPFPFFDDPILLNLFAGRP